MRERRRRQRVWSSPGEVKHATNEYVTPRSRVLAPPPVGWHNRIFAALTNVLGLGIVNSPTFSANQISFSRVLLVSDSRSQDEAEQTQQDCSEDSLET